MRTGTTQVNGASPAVCVIIGSESYYSEGCHSGVDERVVSVSTQELPLGGQYTVIIDNSDEALNAKDYKGQVASITWGFIGYNGSPMCKLWVDTQDFVSQEGQLLLKLTFLDAWGMMSKMTGQPYGSYWNYPWQDLTYLGTLTLPNSTTLLPTDLKTKINSHYSKTIQQIADSVVDDAFRDIAGNPTIDIVWTDLASDTNLNNASIKPTVSANDPRNLVNSAMAASKSYLLWKYDGNFHQVTPDAHAQVYTYTNGTYHFGDEDTHQVVTPNRVIVWYIKKTGNSPDDTPPNWTWDCKTAVNGASYTLLGYYVDVQYNTDFELIDTLTATQAQAKADALMAQIVLSNSTGTLTAPMHCSQELFDLVGISDDRYTVPKGLTGYVFGILREYDRGVYKVTLQLGGTVTGYTPPGGTGVVIVKPPPPLPMPDPPAPTVTWDSILPKAIQGYDSTVVFTSASRTTITWTAGTLKFYDGTTQTIDSSTTSYGGAYTIPGAGVYYGYFNLNAATKSKIYFCLQSDYAGTYMTQYTDILVVVEQGSSTYISATVLPSKGKIPLITADHISMNGIIQGSDTSGNAYGMILTTDIQGGHIKLTSSTVCSGWTLDNVPNGTSYSLVLATDVSSGHINLTSSTVKTGNWYDASGVSIDATTGIHIYGTDSAFTTSATKGGTVQCKVDSTGAIIAGAGKVKLDATGLTIKEGVIYFLDSNSVNCGVLFGETGSGLMLQSLNSKNLILKSATGWMYLYGAIGSGGFGLDQNNVYDAGSSGQKFANVWAVNVKTDVLYYGGYAVTIDGTGISWNGNTVAWD